MLVKCPEMRHFSLSTRFAIARPFANIDRTNDRAILVSLEYVVPSASQTKALILETAVKIASRDGIDGLTIGELAKAVGMSKSGLFAHFRGKDQLQLEVLQKARDQFVDVVLRPAFKYAPGEPRVKAMMKNWLAHLNDDGTLQGGRILIAASIELDDRPGVLRDFAKNVQKDLVANVEKAARIAVEQGHFRKNLDIELFAWSMYSHVLGYFHFKRMLEDPKAELHLKRAFNTLLSMSREQDAGISTKTKSSGKFKSKIRNKKQK